MRAIRVAAGATRRRDVQARRSSSTFLALQQ
jgi:hypothetical protein